MSIVESLQNRQHASLTPPIQERKWENRRKEGGEQGESNLVAHILHSTRARTSLNVAWEARTLYGDYVSKEMMQD